MNGWRFTGKKKMSKASILYYVVPCYNEEETIGYSSERLLNKLTRLCAEGKISPRSKILFVDDGSRDRTRAMLHELTEKDSRFAVVSLSGNRGHQNAIMAGMMVAKDHADAVITIDADLQQDPEATDLFLEKFDSGCDIVYGIRNDRKTDGVFKKGTASLYYRIMKMFGTQVIPNSADYRLLSKKALNALSEYKETNLFLRGLIPTMGFASDVVYFDVKEREYGKSKYTLSKMLTLAADGITSFSIKPIHMIVSIGSLVCLFSILVAVFTLVMYIKGQNVPGYTTSIIIQLLMGGVTLVSLGIIGEYLGRVYLETKQRPRYIIDTVVLKDTKDTGEEEETDSERPHRPDSEEN